MLYENEKWSFRRTLVSFCVCKNQRPFDMNRGIKQAGDEIH